MMQIDLRHQPSSTTARITLNPGESCQAEAGAMMASSTGLQVAAQARGGVMKSLLRATVGGESLFITTYTADSAAGGWVDLASNLAGDAAIIDISDASPWLIASGSWLANTPGVNLDTTWGGAKMLFSGNGAFLIRATGQGSAVVTSYGALDRIDLAAGQGLTIDTGHLVAFQASVQTNVRKATRGVVQTVKSGEGLVMEVTGPGQVLMQSRSPQSLLSWLSGAISSGNS
jgi:uncharacterized protein (TIGR00266 family)